jgi:hypothetical protein
LAEIECVRHSGRGPLLAQSARKIVEQAGFHPDVAITLVDDCGIKRGPPTK